MKALRESPISDRLGNVKEEKWHIFRVSQSLRIYKDSWMQLDDKIRRKMEKIFYCVGAIDSLAD